MKRKFGWCLLVFWALAIVAALYVYTHPLVFNESMWGHAHCIKIAGVAFHNYAARLCWPVTVRSEGLRKCLASC